VVSQPEKKVTRHYILIWQKIKSLSIFPRQDLGGRDRKTGKSKEKEKGGKTLAPFFIYAII